MSPQKLNEIAVAESISLEDERACRDPFVMSWKKPKRLWRWGMGIIALGFLAFNALCFLHAWHMTHFVAGPPQPQSWPSQLLFGRKMYKPSLGHDPSQLGLNFETITISSPRGFNLQGWWIPHPEPRFQVLGFHGHGGCKADLLEAAAHLHRWGGQVLLVDFPGSGGSEGNVTTIGWHEAEDVAAAAQWVSATKPSSLSTGFYGTSLGAVAVMRSAHLGKVRPDFVILECPFATMTETVRKRFRHYKLPPWVVSETLVFWGGAMHGFNAFQHNPVDYAVSLQKTPSLLLYGGKDHTTDVSEFRSIGEALGPLHRDHCFENLGHESFVHGASAEWTQSVRELIEKHLPVERSSSPR